MVRSGRRSHRRCLRHSRPVLDLFGIPNLCREVRNFIEISKNEEKRFLADHPSEVVFAHVTINSKEGDDFKSQKVYTKEYAEKWWNAMFQNINRCSQLYARNHGGSL